MSPVAEATGLIAFQMSLGEFGVGRTVREQRIRDQFRVVDRRVAYLAVAVVTGP